MNRLIATLAAGVVAVGLAAGAVAAPKPGEPGQKPARAGAKGERAAHGMRAIMAKLNLTPVQAQKVREIQKSSRDEMKALKPEDRKTKGRELRKATQEKILAVLTPEQRTKLQTEMKEMRKNRPAKGTRPAGGKRAAKAAGQPK